MTAAVTPPGYCGYCTVPRQGSQKDPKGPKRTHGKRTQKDPKGPKRTHDINRKISKLRPIKGHPAVFGQLGT
jgi:hypothetical protein